VRAWMNNMPLHAGFWLGVLAAGPAAGQELLEGGISLVVAGVHNGIYVHVGDDHDRDDGHCVFRRALLKAEAERTLRRDGIPVALRPAANSGPALLIRVDMLPTGDLCAISLDVELVFAGPVDAELFVLAARGGNIMVREPPGHVRLLRRNVEEIVSVIANAIRSHAQFNGRQFR